MTHDLRPRILVFGVGGAGGNAVDNMIEANLQGVEFIVANTDAQALSRSKTETRIQLGPETTSGLGAGARPDVGEEAAQESLEEIKSHLEGANMVFIAAGMGGGTGTGAAPIIAKAASDMDILTVAVVTKPFSFEGTRRMDLAAIGLESIRDAVDTMIVVPNQNLFQIANAQTTFAEAFRMADDVLYSGVRGITDLMVMPGLINLDFADVKSIMHGMGTAMMGMGEAEGEGRALAAARSAIDNPLLDEVSMHGAKGVLINITGGYDMTLFELDEAANEIRSEVDANANIIIGSAFDTELEGKIRVSVVAAGVDANGAHAPVARPALNASAVSATPIHDAPAPSQSDADAANGEDEAPADERPVVITQGGTTSTDTARSPEPDTRDDFAGEPLPADHIPGQKGADTVTPDNVFGDGTDVPTDTGPKPEEDPSGFSHLFGWRRNADSSEEGAEPAVPPTIIDSPDDTPEATPFDDEDLEIPAFLRRSANH